MTQRIRHDTATGEIRLDVPGAERLRETLITLNDEQQFTAVMVDNSLHYADVRALVVQDIIDENELAITNNEVSLTSLQREGYFSLIFKRVFFTLQGSWSYLPQLKYQFLAVRRELLVKAAAQLIDIITLHDIQEDEAQSEPEENTDA